MDYGKKKGSKELLPADRKVKEVNCAYQPGAMYGEPEAIQDKSLSKGKAFMKSKAMNGY